MNDDLYYDFEKAYAGLGKYLSKDIIEYTHESDFDLDKLNGWVNQYAQPYTQYRYVSHIWGVNPHSVSVDEEATIAAFKVDEFVNKLIKSINERNDNVIRGNRIFGPAYVTGEFINFTERFSFEDGYVDAVVKNMLIPVIKSKADNTIGTIDLSVYINGNKQDIPSKLENKLNNAIYNYILRHAIYTEE